MKQRNRARSSTLFLMELIIAILFFTVCSAVCVQFFAKSHSLSQQSWELNFAVNECSSVAELIQSADTEANMKDMLKSVYPNATFHWAEDSADCEIFFNEELSQCISHNSDSAYCVSVNIESSNGMADCSIAALSKGNKEPIYSLEIRHNIQEAAK